jgi:hypothetical protein
VQQQAPQQQQPQPQADTQQQQQQQQSRPQSTPKVLASAAIRLYSLNPHTNGYDAVNGGNPLGCVIMGMNTSYQILVYDGQVDLHTTYNANVDVLHCA